MANFNRPIIDTKSLSEPSGNNTFGRIGFLNTRPDLTIEYAEYRKPGTLWGFYRVNDGLVELYISDPSGYKFLAVR